MWTHKNPYPRNEPVRSEYERDLSHLVCWLNLAKQNIRVEDNLLRAMWEMQLARAYVVTYGHLVPGFNNQKFFWYIEQMNNVLLKNGFSKAISQKDYNKFIGLANEASKELYDPSAGSEGEYFDQDKFDREHGLGSCSK